MGSILSKNILNSHRSDIHILVVDDDNRIRKLLKTYLVKSGFRVSECKSAEHARAKMNGLCFDLLILDVMMPEETGFEFTRKLRQHNDIPIILLTAKGDVNNRIEGLRAGADDYISKPFEPEELVLRIESIFKRLASTAVGPKVNFGPFSYNHELSKLFRNHVAVHLTSSEVKLLDILSRKNGGVVTRHALSTQIGAKSERAVDIQIIRLRQKIENNPSIPEYLVTVRGIGYRLVVESP